MKKNIYKTNNCIVNFVSKTNSWFARNVEFSLKATPDVSNIFDMAALSSLSEDVKSELLVNATNTLNWNNKIESLADELSTGGYDNLLDVSDHSDLGRKIKASLVIEGATKSNHKALSSINKGMSMDYQVEFDGCLYDCSSNKNALYNWLACQKIHALPERDALLGYDCFVSFGASTKGGSPAEACAIYTSLSLSGNLDVCLDNFNSFLSVVYLTSATTPAVKAVGEDVSAKYEVGLNVHHTSFGDGIIEANDGTHITINFNGVVKKFNIEQCDYNNLIKLV